MIMIYAGLILWISVHLFPSVAPAGKIRIVAKFGDNTYQGIFALLVLAGLLMIIFGWRNTIPQHVYSPLSGLRHIAMLIAVIGMILAVAANFPSRIKRYIRHPQLSGVFLWAIAHLIVNGDSRSITVFGALAAWSLVSMFTINRRDGPWLKPAASRGWWFEAAIAVIGLLVSVVVVRFHQYLSGIALVG